MYVIEGWGTGVRRMIKACRNHGVQEPVFTEIGTDFRVEYFRSLPADARKNARKNNEELIELYPEINRYCLLPNRRLILRQIEG